MTFNTMDRMIGHIPEFLLALPLRASRGGEIHNPPSRRAELI